MMLAAHIQILALYSKYRYISPITAPEMLIQLFSTNDKSVSI